MTLTEDLVNAIHSIVSSNTIEQLEEHLFKDIGVVYPLLEYAAMYDLKTTEFSQLLQSSSFTLDEPYVFLLTNIYDAHKDSIRDILEEHSRSVEADRHYSDLRWRLDVELASRSLRNRSSLYPNYLLHLSIGEKTHALSTDYNTLKNLESTLEDAVAFSKSQDSLKINRHVL